MSVACHRGLMTWHLFDVASTDERTRRGFRLIGRLVLRRRGQLGITQRELESLSGIDQTVISRLENGKLGGLRWSRFAELVDALGGLGDTDPSPAWTTRFMPQQVPGPEATRRDETGRWDQPRDATDHQARATATIVERRDGNGIVSRSPTTPRAKVGQ
jgi:transcriptional regulator with XRE-family HTH domain